MCSGLRQQRCPRGVFCSKTFSGGPFFSIHTCQQQLTRVLSAPFYFPALPTFSFPSYLYFMADGIRLSLGSADNLIHDNEIMIHGPDSKYAIYFYQGSDTPMEGSDGRPRGNQFFDNSIISDNEVMKMGNSDNNVFEVRVCVYCCTLLALMQNELCSVQPSMIPRCRCMGAADTPAFSSGRHHRPDFARDSPNQTFPRFFVDPQHPFSPPLIPGQRHLRQIFPLQGLFQHAVEKQLRGGRHAPCQNGRRLVLRPGERPPGTGVLRRGGGSRRAHVLLLQLRLRRRVLLQQRRPPRLS